MLSDDTGIARESWRCLMFDDVCRHLFDEAGNSVGLRAKAQGLLTVQDSASGVR